MAKSKVYFTDMRTKAFGKGLMGKLANLLKAAGMDQIDFNGKFTAIKIHFGEPGNLSFLRPNGIGRPAAFHFFHELPGIAVHSGIIQVHCNRTALLDRFVIWIVPATHNSDYYK